ncbi:MAG: hypothetical protein A2Y22_02665 [Clostridiales bacterium GWD2_32_59]|nr:MAG: hypothetical protein A2Y22_02665 [Clostridiales bacterium GWD2_32_59]
MIKKLHSIYSNEVPRFIIDLANTTELKRLEHVGQNCGQDYLNAEIFNPIFNYSRLDHSIGVALIIWNFTKDIRQSISGLFHDISTPTFAHVIDFLKKDYVNQEITEVDTIQVIRQSEEILKILNEYDILPEDVEDYKKYSIADNKAPKLSADRLEYTFYLSLTRGKIKIEEVEKIYKRIVICNNEEDEPEMVISEPCLAERLMKISIENGRFMSGKESKISGQMLADILELCCNKNILKEEDLYIYKEEEIVEKIRTSSEKEILSMWELYTKFDEVLESDDYVEGKYCIHLDVKRRYINPLVFVQEKLIRTIDISNRMKKILDDYLHDKSVKYIYVK